MGYLVFYIWRYWSKLFKDFGNKICHDKSFLKTYVIAVVFWWKTRVVTKIWALQLVIHVLVSLNFSFAKLTCAFLACKKKLSGQKQFSSEKNDDIFQIFDQLIVSRWIVYSHWEVTWNYAYSPFNWGRSNLRREEGGCRGKNAFPAPGYLFASMFKHVQ